MATSGCAEIDLRDANLDKELCAACRSGPIDLVHSLIKSGARNWNGGLYYACLGGQYDIAVLMLAKGACLLNNALAGACHGGNYRLVSLLLDNGADQVNDGLILALSITFNNALQQVPNTNKDEYHDVVALLLQQDSITTLTLSTGLNLACALGRLNTVLLLIKYGADAWNSGLHYACQYGHYDIAKLMIDKGADTLNAGLSTALLHRHYDIAILLVERGAIKYHTGIYNDAMAYACVKGKINLIYLLIKKGANDWNRGLIAACTYNQHDTAALMIEKGADIDKCTLELSIDAVTRLIRLGVPGVANRYMTIAKKIESQQQTLNSYLIGNLTNIIAKY